MTGANGSKLNMPNGSDPIGTPPPAAHPLRPNSPRALRDAEEDRTRQRQNIAAALLVVALLGAVYWVFTALSDEAKLEACLTARHRNCGPPDTAPPK